MRESIHFSGIQFYTLKHDCGFIGICTINPDVENQGVASGFIINFSLLYFLHVAKWPPLLHARGLWQREACSSKEDTQPRLFRHPQCHAPEWLQLSGLPQRRTPPAWPVALRVLSCGGRERQIPPSFPEILQPHLLQALQCRETLLSLRKGRAGNCEIHPRGITKSSIQTPPSWG